MKKRIFATALLSTTFMAACSLGGSSSSVTDSFNTSPVILNTQLNVQVTENQGPEALAIVALDGNFEQLRLEISGTDADDLVHVGRGIIAFVDGPDFEAPTDADGNNVYEITVTVSDSVTSDSKNFTIEVLDDVADNGAVTAKCSASGAYQSCTIPSGGVDRAFTLYVPPSYGDQSAPLLFSLHGSDETANDHLAYTGFQDLADKAGFIVAYPQGSVLEATGKTHWNTGSGGVDDTAFIDTISEYLSTTYNVDTKRVFAAGMGEGGAMSYHLACSASDQFAAVGSVSGAMTTPNCAPSSVVPTVHIHGKLDGVEPYAGGALSQPIDEVVAFWTKANGCPGAGSLSFISDSPADGDIMGGILTAFNGCEAGSSVEYFLLDGMGHAWPNSQSFDLGAAETLWGFFSGIER